MKNRDKISRDDYRQQINMEAAYSQETKTSQHHHQTIKLATRQKIKSNSEGIFRLHNVITVDQVMGVFISVYATSLS
jgi:hypothetical protein